MSPRLIYTPQVRRGHGVSTLFQRCRTNRQSPARAKGGEHVTPTLRKNRHSPASRQSSRGVKREKKQRHPPKPPNETNHFRTHFPSMNTNSNGPSTGAGMRQPTQHRHYYHIGNRHYLLRTLLCTTLVDPLCMCQAISQAPYSGQPALKRGHLSAVFMTHFTAEDTIPDKF